MKVYLGDGVYGNTRHRAIVLTTEVGNGISTNEIVLELEVLQNFFEFVQNLKEKKII